jgi:hypothetical protein
MSYIGNEPPDTGAYGVQSFDGGGTTFTLSKPSTTATVLLFIDGVRQTPVDAYSVSGVTLTTTATTPSGTDNVTVQFLGDVVDFGEPSDDSVSTVKIQDDAVTNAKVADNALSGNKIDGGTISDFASTGIDDNADAVAITIDSSENVGIGETTPLGKVHIQSASSGTIAPSGNADELVIEGSGHAGISLYSGTTSTGLINFGDDGHDSPGQIIYDHNDNSFQFVTNTGERFRFASSGQLGVAGANYGTSGQVLTSGGASSAPSWAAAGKILQVTSASITTEVRTTSTSFVASGMIATLPNAIQAGSLVAMWLSGGTMLTGSWTAKTYTTFYYSFAGGAYTVTSADPLEYIVWAGTSGTVEGIPHSMNYLLNPGGAGTVAIQPYFKASSGDNQYFNEAGYRATMIVMEIGA